MFIKSEKVLNTFIKTAIEKGLIEYRDDSYRILHCDYYFMNGGNGINKSIGDSLNDWIGCELSIVNVNDGYVKIM